MVPRWSARSRSRSQVVPAIVSGPGTAPIWLSSSTNGPNGSSPPLTGVQCPTATNMPSRRAWSAIDPARRLFPIPDSPRMSAILARPDGRR